MAPTVLKRPSDDNIDFTTCCIICLKPNKLISTENGRKRIMEAAKVRNDEVQKQLQSVSLDAHFKYHMDYQCYKSYTRIDRLSRKVKVRNSHTYNETHICVNLHTEYIKILHLVCENNKNKVTANATNYLRGLQVIL